MYPAELCQHYQTDQGSGHFRRESLQDLDRLRKWANKNLIKFSKDKYKLLHLGKHIPRVKHRLGSSQLGSSSVESDLRVLVDKKINRSK